MIINGFYLLSSGSIIELIKLMLGEIVTALHNEVKRLNIY